MTVEYKTPLLALLVKSQIVQVKLNQTSGQNGAKWNGFKMAGSTRVKRSPSNVQVIRLARTAGSLERWCFFIDDTIIAIARSGR